ncbi:trafficking protein particle complex subunit 13 [Chrysoperla carnea]|uniref:trafficking protein particle complex subunit 13 n=1 Tax=Chrysoperla carnea TaxID=189513 RepID=UPI001D086CB3|nr:trafficking protein particle complex subunit 13 [Chrysoperla carnea]
MENVEHLVALKVMRLTRPKLASPLIVTSETKDLPGNLLNNELKQDVTAAQGVETIGKGQFLLLPQSFGTIFLGGIFSSYICVHNETNEPVQHVSIKADLQTSKQRVRLSSDKSIDKLGPDDTLNDVIHHEVKEIGTHILVCEVSYLSKTGVTVSFRKFFNFVVNKPLDVKTKFYNTETDEVYLEAQVRNITGGPICLEKVALNASNSFTVKSLNSADENDEESVFGKTNILQAHACCQYLYCLIPNESLRSNIKSLLTSTNIGKLDIVWRSNLGEIGRLQTCRLEKMGITCHDIRLIVKDLPNCALLEKKFTMTCKVINCCDRKMELSLELEQNLNRGLSWCCCSGYKLAELNPTESLEFSVEMVAIKSGFLTIGGIKLIDSFLNRTYEFDQVAQIYILKYDATQSDLDSFQ